MKMRNVLVAASVLLAVAGAASAQKSGRIGKGITEYDLFGNIHFDSPASQTVTARWAPFIDDAWQAGVDLNLTHTKKFHDPLTGKTIAGTGTTGFIDAIANYHFRSSGSTDTIPYLGAAVGTTFGSGTNTSVWGFQGGIKHFLNPNVAFFAELDWRRAGKRSFAGRRSNTDLNFGLAFFK